MQKRGYPAALIAVLQPKTKPTKRLNKCFAGFLYEKISTK